MNVVLQIPIIDLRNLIKKDYSKLKVPLWPNPKPYDEFMRLIGCIERRSDGRNNELIGEDVICNAKKGIRFIEKQKRIEIEDGFVTLIPISRSFVSYGIITSKYEVGFKLKINSQKRELSEKDFVKIIDEILSIKIRIPTLYEGGVDVSLGSCKKYFLKQYKESSSYLGKSILDDNTISYGTPMLLFHANGEKIKFALDKSWKNCFADSDEIKISIKGLNKSGLIRILLLENNGGGNPKVSGRDLRVTFLKNNSIRESLHHVIKRMNWNEFEFTKNSNESNQLQMFFKESISCIIKPSRGIFIQSTVFEIEKSLKPDEVANLLKCIKLIRPQIKKMVETYIDSVNGLKDSEKSIFNKIEISQNTINIMNNSVENNGDGNVINTGDNSSIDVNIQINKNDKINLSKKLLNNDVHQDDVDDLLSVIDEKIPDKNEGEFGSKVNDWIKKMIDKSLNGSWSVGIGAAGSLLADLIKSYYGK